MEISGISEKSRSLDLQSIYREKSRAAGEKSRAETRREESRPLKRKERSSSPVKKRRKGRKELPLSTFEAEGSGTQKGTDALGQSASNSVPSKLKELMLYGKNPTKRKNGSVLLDGNWKNTSNNFSHESGDNGIVVPKRPRGFFGQKNLQSDHVGKRVVNSRVRRTTNLGNGSSDKTSGEVEKSNLNGHLGALIPSSVGKKKKAVDDYKENSSIQANSDLPVASEDASGNSAPRKIQRSSRKRRKPVAGKSVTKVELPAVPNDVEVFENVQEDDEENLEQNAARMLSSRFDPSCTGFSRNSAGSKSQSADGSLHPSLFRRKFRSSGRSTSAESEAVSVDSAGRVLRPRKQHRHRGLFRRRRRHFYEINSTELDAYWVVNQRIKVFWPLDMSWYFGVVKEYDPKTNLHHVKYDDRDEEWINLQNERFKLLLLPGEVPGKISPEKSGIRRKHVEEDDANGLNDDSFVGNCMESEPIISWLARSTRRVKSSPLGIAKKQKRCHTVKNNLHSTSSDNTVEISKRCLADGLARTDTDELSIGSVMLEKSRHREMADQSVADSCAHSRDGKPPLVYFRKRFRKVQPLLNKKLEERSVDLPASLADGVGVQEDFDIVFQNARMKNSKRLGQQSLLQLQEHFCMPKLFDPSTEVEVKMRLCLPPLQVYDIAFGSGSFWHRNTLLLLQFGRLMAALPTVHLEMLFMDNIVGVRYLLFEGCLRQAAAFMCFILGIFQQSGECGMHDDLQLPVTSIRFQLSGLQDVGRRLVFVFYNFLEIASSKWLCLDNKLKKYCIVAKELPLSECTYDNITMLQSGVDRNVNTPVIEEPARHQGPEKRIRQGIKHWGYSSSKFKERPGGLPPFVLSFAAAPSFFRSLHLKMLMKNDVASISFQNSYAQENPKKYLTTSHHSVTRVMDKNDNVDDSDVQDAVMSKHLSCIPSKVETAVLPVSRDANWTDLSQNTALNTTRAGVDSQELEMHKNLEGSKQADKFLCHSDSFDCAGRSCSSASEDLSAQDESDSRCASSLTGANIQTPLCQVDGQSIDKGVLSTQLCMSDLAWNVTDCAIRSTNPTAPRTMWHRSRRSSFPSSFSNHSKLWPDGSADFARNGFVNGSRKPRSQVGYLSHFGGYSFGSKPRSHLQKGHPYKRIKNENEKILSDGWRSTQVYTDSLSCSANVLVTAADRGWRECGAQVVLESADHHDWRLSVKISGTTRYVHKPHQFLQPGTTNRYTHVMMWKGEKDWILEFPDRSQWTLFKGMHEECYNRNIRAASVKNIPIPGVRLVEDSDDNAIEVPYVRNSPKYFRLVGTEVDMAMDPTRVFYDMESDDERWISEFRNSGVSGTQPPEVSDEIFEKVMDMFEKVSYAQQREDFSNDEVECFMDGVGPVDIVKAVYGHWQQKRKKKGMNLIRQLQPPLWERYQQQLKDWELVVSRTVNHSNGCKEKVLPEKPPMFAFCLRPRGLEVPNKGTKQRSHRKFTAIGQYGSFSRDLDVPQTLGRRLNGFAAIGDEKALVTVQNHESFDVSPRLQFSLRSSPRDVTATGILSISSDGSERNQHTVFHRTKSKKMGVHLAPSDLQMATTSCSPRTMGKKNGANRLNTGMPEWPTLRHYQGDGFQRHRVDQLGCSEFDEFRLRDASSAAQHASNMAKLKREKAQRLMHKADVALHKAVSALMVAEAMRASEEDLIGDG